MQSAINRFLRYMLVERNAADLTIKSYREDLAGLLEYLGKCSLVSLDHFIISRLHKASHLRKQIRELEEGWIQVLAEMEFARWLISNKHQPDSCGSRPLPSPLPQFQFPTEKVLTS